MQLIDGVGDEVVHFAAAVVVMLVAALAWWSTNARMDRYRTILMRQRTDHPVTLSIRTNAASLTMLYTNRQTNASGQSTTETENVTSTVAAVSTGPAAGSGDVVPLQEMDSIVDADMAVLENNRLHFYRRINSPRTVQIASESTTDSETDAQEESEPASNAQIREMDSIVSAMEGDETNNCAVFSRPHGNDSNPSTLINRCQTEHNDKDPQSRSNSEDTAANTEGDVTGDTDEGNDRKILIRLKYLNDTLKEVEGSLDELLKDFKWRHFSSELSSSSRVRLIFNGRVLGDEAATLRALGLHHRAVVHCLVHPNRNIAQRGPTEEAAPLPTIEGVAPRAPPERAWDLENILMTLVSVALTVVWFFRCEYSNMFTASASVALFGLTVFYSVAIFGLYLSDTFHFDRRPQLPNN